MIQSPVFWITLVVSVLIFWRLPERLRYGFVALVSYGYLVTLDAASVNILIALTLIFFFLAPHALARKDYSGFALPGLIGLALGYLFYEKYLPSLLQRLELAASDHTILVPLGISYFTFKLIHYAIEVARGNINDRSLSKFFCYIFLFPIFTAGPIERFDHFDANIEKTWRSELAVIGCTRIIYGLIKVFVLSKLVSAEVVGLGIPASIPELTEELPTLAPAQTWGFLILSYLYAYLDFSAYSDIAIGASRLFGFRIMENFRFPVLARNISDFWNRWHMTLALWCRSYVYMPIIAYTRNPYLATYGTFVAMGLWHGATAPWVMWGLYHASGVAFYTTWSRIRRKLGQENPIFRLTSFAGIPLTFLFVSGSYAFSSTGDSGRKSIVVFLRLFGIHVEV